MSQSARITLIVDDVAGSGLMPEHGLAMWVERGGAHVLFDTGAGGALLPNAASLGIDLSRADAVVLSHGHYDHTGGLEQVLDAAPRAKVYAHPRALRLRYRAAAGGKSRSIGMPRTCARRLRHEAGRAVLSARPACVAEGIFTTGAIPRRFGPEKAGRDFFLDAACTVPDVVEDDQALLVETGGGLVVLLGCAHAGVINTLEHIRTMHPGRRIRAVIGGMHLKSASPNRLAWTLHHLGRCGAEMIACAHCTGKVAGFAMRQLFGKACHSCRAGSRFVFD